MKSLQLKNSSRGVGMVEIMVGVTISSLLTIAVITVYLSQNVMFNQQSSRNYASSDAWDVYAVVSNMIRHAQINSFTINYGEGGRNDESPAEIELLNTDGDVTNDEITIDFSVPAGMSVWPNNVSPFNNNIFSLTWQNFGGDSYEIQITTDDGSGPSDPILLAGGNTGGNTKIINFDLWPLDEDGNLRANITDTPTGGYRLVISTRSSMKAGSSDPVFTVSGVIVPRNS